MDDQNPTLTPLLRLITAVECFVLAIAGGSLFLIMDTARTQWGWQIGPFNARFVGAIYLASLIAVALMLVFNRWLPARLVLPMIFIFTFLVLIVSLLNTELFDFSKWFTWAWFVLYIFLPINSAYHLWLYRRLPSTDPAPASPLWRGYLWLQVFVTGLYGLGLLLIPVAVTGFWPWKIDDFHGQVYSAIFITGALGSVLMLRAASSAEWLTLGVAQIALGFLSIAGLLFTDAAVPAARKIDWSQFGTWIWVGIFAISLLAGLAMLWQWRVQRRKT